jgi:salicylate hydroxylase
VPFHDVEETYGSPYYFIHRADLLNALGAEVRKRDGVRLLMGKKVVEYDFEGGRVRTESQVGSEWWEGDLVVAADGMYVPHLGVDTTLRSFIGIKSIARDTINGSPAKAVDTGDVAYRILVPAAGLLKDPELASLVKEPWATTWAGPEGHFVGYPLRGGELYNMIICCSVKSTLHGKSLGEEDWLVTADNAELVRRFEGWCSPVQKLCALAGEVSHYHISPLKNSRPPNALQIPFLKWKMCDLHPLSHWVHPSNRVTLLGDSCHPMLPYLAQGAAQATEDAGTLRSCLSTYPSIPSALRAYEAQRKPRTENIIANTRIHQDWLHLYDGPVRDERDRLFLEGGKQNPIFWAYRPRKDWLFGSDAEVLLGEGERGVPELPPRPPKESSVYWADGELEAARASL